MKFDKVTLIIAMAGLVATGGGLAAGGQAANGKARMSEQPKGNDRPIANLPFAHGRSFATLNAYLAHLRRYAGPVGQPWYREIRPGVYELVTTVQPPSEPETYTRAALMERFGFSR
jgi:hypothetical protein